ncbi:uncharacterized protein LOC130749124 [Lotus japonicus]|uniref:uncharacterized protein LOC130749124 n=1 Tax=Lotus japonicus TaxID=34305 RepID=UPI00258E50F0|nr:uncharacterized protein LOC130749124 [Lotus japonicus]
MKMLSFNARGVGERAKRRVIRELVTQNQVEVLCIQETKIQRVDRRICSQLWGDSNFEWKAVQAINRGGGLVTVWNSSSFTIEECVEGRGFLGLIGTWKKSQQKCVLVNVYSPCDMAGKRALWSDLRAWRGTCQELAWCVAGDFNAVRDEEERRGVVGVSTSQRIEMQEFNAFIADMDLVDLPLAGRKFTWRRPNNQASSRIDRFLVSEEWCVRWPNCSQLALHRDVSDHCPLLLR